MRGRLGFVLAIVGVLAATACTSSPPRPVPDRVLSPAPTSCPLPPARASAIPSSSLAEAMHGHVPSWLPSGVGLVAAFGPGWGALAGAYWADGRCREIQMFLYPSGGSLGSGPLVGDWVLYADAPHGCGNAILGSAAGCLDYHAEVAEGLLNVQMMGFERGEADRIVRSVPT